MSLNCGSPALSAFEPELPIKRTSEYTRDISGECEVVGVGKFRNGRPKVWCKTHAQVLKDFQASTCEHRGRSLRLRCLSIDIDCYSGGIGIWGSLPPAIDTAESSIDTESILRGLHVHARPEANLRKMSMKRTILWHCFEVNSCL